MTLCPRHGVWHNEPMISLVWHCTGQVEMHWVDELLIEQNSDPNRTVLLMLCELVRRFAVDHGFEIEHLPGETA